MSLQINVFNIFVFFVITFAFESKPTLLSEQRNHSFNIPHMHTYLYSLCPLVFVGVLCSLYCFRQLYLQLRIIIICIVAQDMHLLTALTFLPFLLLQLVSHTVLTCHSNQRAQYKEFQSRKKAVEAKQLANLHIANVVLVLFS